MIHRLPRLWNRPEPELDRQPFCLEHLRDMGRAVPKRILSNDAYGAFLVLAASRVRIADAYTHAGGEWVLELHGAYPWQECRFSPEQWQAFYEVFLAVPYTSGTLDGGWWLIVCRHLAEQHPNGQLASIVASVMAATRRVRGEVRPCIGASFPCSRPSPASCGGARSC
jgi:hypothetical protein